MDRDSPGAVQRRSRRNSIGARRSLLRLCATLALAAAPLCAPSQAAPVGSGVGTETGIATVYGMNMQGQPTSSGSAQIRMVDTSSSAPGHPCENEAPMLGLTGISCNVT